MSSPISWRAIATRPGWVANFSHFSEPMTPIEPPLTWCGARMMSDLMPLLRASRSAYSARISATSSRGSSQRGTIQPFSRYCASSCSDKRASVTSSSPSPRPSPAQGSSISNVPSISTAAGKSSRSTEGSDADHGLHAHRLVVAIGGRQRDQVPDRLRIARNGWAAERAGQAVAGTRGGRRCRTTKSTARRGAYRPPDRWRCPAATIGVPGPTNVPLAGLVICGTGRPTPERTLTFTWACAPRPLPSTTAERDRVRAGAQQAGERASGAERAVPARDPVHVGLGNRLRPDPARRR